MSRGDPEFDYRFIAVEVHRLGHPGSENRIHRLWGLVISSRIRRRARVGECSGPAVANELVLREFSAKRPDAVWPTEVTEIPMGEGKLNMSAVKRACSRRIIGWATVLPPMQPPTRSRQVCPYRVRDGHRLQRARNVGMTNRSATVGADKLSAAFRNALPESVPRVH